MHHIDSGFYIYLTLAMAALTLASIIIPLYGFLSKRWKGLALGCLIQPFALIVIYLLLAGGVYLYDTYSKDKCRKDAMVTVHQTVVQAPDTVWHTWYLKPDEECFHEYRFTKTDDDGDSIVKLTTDYYDVVRLDSTSVGVEDRLVVRFDFKARTVTATDYNDSAEIVSVNWDKVKAYFRNMSATADE